MSGFSFPYTNAREDGTDVGIQPNLNFLTPIGGPYVVQDAPNNEIDVDLATMIATGSGWTRDAGPPATVRLTTATDQIAVGTAVAAVGRKLTLQNEGTNLGLRISTVATSDNAIDVMNGAEAVARLTLRGTGALLWSTGAAAADVQLSRGGVNLLDVLADNATNAAVTDVLSLTHTTSGAPAAGIATGLLFQAEDDAGPPGIVVQAARIAGVLTSAATGAVDGALDLYTRTGGGALTARWRVAAAGGLTPLVDNTLAIGTSSLRVLSLSTGSTGSQVFATLGAANPVAQLAGTGLGLGQGAAVPVAWFLAANAVTTTRADMATGNALNAIGVGTFQTRALLADAQVTSQLGPTGLTLGPGGAAIPDWSLLRTGAALGGVTGTLATQGRVVQTTYIAAATAPAYVVLATDDFIGRDTTTAPRAITMPAAVDGRSLTIANTALNVVLNALTLTADGAETFNTSTGALAAIDLTGAQAVRLTGRTGVGWYLS